jgi:hypothetical protein
MTSSPHSDKKKKEKKMNCLDHLQIWISQHDSPSDRSAEIAAALSEFRMEEETEEFRAPAFVTSTPRAALQ